MKGNLTYILSWLAYTSRNNTINPVRGDKVKYSFCAIITRLSEYNCNGCDCPHCPFIRYKQSYLESY